jgi:hypothetical protein
MQYAMLIHTDPSRIESLSESDLETAYAEYLELANDPRLVTFAQLQPVDTATCVRGDGEQTLITDGPFADTKEVLGGLCIVEAADLDEVLELASRSPAVKWVGGTVEIRPLAQP